eukprot:TRINITY_DN810_c0_g1_i1.p1 TRINITY_DN810_c0_g1~~TRINITY_DN810_c0_g1_i1.p1  ORF type:complete len:684 (+),score=199.77 TRINITY_DN810_c0_g1_i1:62-2113(+)
MKRRWNYIFLIFGMLVLFAGGTNSINLIRRNLSLRQETNIPTNQENITDRIQFLYDQIETNSSFEAIQFFDQLIDDLNAGKFGNVNPIDYCNDLSILALQISSTQAGTLLSSICNSTLLFQDIAISPFQAKVLMSQIRYNRRDSQLLFSNISAIALALLRNDSVDSIGVDTANLSIVTQKWRTPRSVSGNTSNGSFFSIPTDTVSFATKSEFRVLFSSLSYNPMVPVSGALTRNIVGAIVGLNLLNVDGSELPVKNAPSNITIDIPVYNYNLSSSEAYICLWWNASAVMWRGEGCTNVGTTVVSMNTTIVRCFCNHLTNFTVAAASIQPRAGVRKIGLEFIVGPVVAGAAVLVIVVAVAIIAVKRSTKRKRKKDLELREVDTEPLELLPFESVADPKTMGDSSDSFKGLFNGDVDVYVKKLNPKWNVKTIRTEAKGLESLRNPQILKFFGFWQDSGNNLRIVLEHASLGNLKEFFLNEPDVPRAQRLTISMDIATGMSYLEKNQVVHKDLRIRNVFVSKIHGGYCIKVGNAVLNSSLGDSEELDIKHRNEEELYRTRWMAPELIKSRKYSNKTDIWAFGVVLWEVFHNGNEPYGISEEPSDVAEAILDGKRLQFSDKCPTICEELAAECWDERPSKRPTFGAILSSLSLALDEESGSDYRHSSSELRSSQHTEDSRRFSINKE